MAWYNPFSWFSSKPEVHNNGQQVYIMNEIDTNNNDLEAMLLYISVILTIYLVIKIHKAYIKRIQKKMRSEL